MQANIIGNMAGIVRLEAEGGTFRGSKRTIILQLSLVGLVFQTAVYIYVWQHVYNEIMQQGMWRSFHEKGFYLLAAVYFLLILFFTGTYGGLKIGYLKTMDVFFHRCFLLYLSM